MTDCDFDIGPALSGTNFTGETPWLVGGNEITQLPSTPVDGFFQLGIDVPLPPVDDTSVAAEQQREIACAGINFITSGEERIRTYGEACDDPDYQEFMRGKTLITNGFIETEEVPAELVIIPAPPIGTGTAAVSGGSVSNLYLERPSNVYSITLTETDVASLLLIPTGFPVDLLGEDLVLFGGADVDAPYTEEAFNLFLEAAALDPLGPAGIALDTLRAEAALSGISIAQFDAYVRVILPYLQAGVVPGESGVRVFVISNIFLGDAPTPSVPVLSASYNPDGVLVQPNPSGYGSQIYQELGINSFEYLLKILNATETDIALFFGTPSDTLIGGLTADQLDADNSDIYSNANVGGAGFFLIPTSGAGFFDMRVNEGVTHTMLSNVEYTDYVEPTV